MAQISPEIIEWLRQNQGLVSQYIDQNTGHRYGATYSGGSNYEDSNQYGQGTHVGYSEDDGPQWYEGKLGTAYDTTGKETGKFEIEDFNKMDLGEKLATAFVMVTGAAAGAGALGYGPAAAGAAGGAAGGAGGAAAGGGYTFGTTGSIGGYGAATGTGAAWAPAGAGGAGFGATTAEELAMAGEGAFTGTNAAGGAATGSGLGGATAGGTLWDGVKAAGSRGGKLLGAGATLLGGAAGASGGGEGGGGGDSTRTMDPRMDPYVYGDQGIMKQTQGLLNQQLSPEAMAQWQKMQGVGMGLLQQPVAGNGFERFYGGKK